MSLSILIVNDDPEQRRLLEELLRRLGYDVVSADSGETALAKLARPDRIAPLPNGTTGPQRTSRISAIETLDAAGELRPFAEVEADVIRFALAHHRGRMALVARKLGIGRSTLYRKLKELNLAETDGIAAQ